MTSLLFHLYFEEAGDQDENENEHEEPQFEDHVVSFLCGIVFISGYALLTNKIV